MTGVNTKVTVTSRYRLKVIIFIHFLCSFLSNSLQTKSVCLKQGLGVYRAVNTFHLG